MAESHAGSGAQGAARRAFEQAAEIAEVRQCALVALTLMSMRDGQLASAADLTKGLDATDVPADDSADAWTAYVSGRRANHDAVLALMREVLWQRLAHGFSNRSFAPWSTASPSMRSRTTTGSRLSD